VIRHALFLAVRSLRASPGRSVALVLGLAVALFLPAFTVLVGRLAEGRLLDRAEATPIVVGHAGNEFDLVLSSLYFRGEVAAPVSQADVEALRAKRYGLVVPMDLRFTAGGAPVVGTTLDYLDQRGLALADGRRFAVLGEAVVGAEVARAANLRPGDALRSDQSNLYDLSGAYPLLLRVVGVLAPTGTPDDEAVFVDVKTTWVMEGLLHGHDAVTRSDASGVAARDVVGGTEENLEASLALFVFAEITPENLGSFHLHGEAADWPVSSILVWPKDARAHDQLLGDLAVEETRQAVRPVQVVRTILGIVLRVQELLGVFVVLVAASTAAFVALVTSLSLRLRADEIRLMRRIGAGKGTVALLLGAEVALLLGAATLTAAGLTWAARATLTAVIGW
jgi:putative ABC transport system permease protein